MAIETIASGRSASIANSLSKLRLFRGQTSVRLVIVTACQMAMPAERNAMSVVVEITNKLFLRSLRAFCLA